ncbi:hypothetical protein [Geoglobus acetivorans]|uniref:DUF8180 domain-containing protein n=1 Tax=Geoglobus acetivorans TaxID=565033 RepID=A0ABZ3H3B5_GEOAI|nr:hypothetical protein [Geoglobus acetivorans]
MEIEKLKHLLQHWIDHNNEHVSKYLEWAEKIEDEYPDVSQKIKESIEFFESGNLKLKEAFELIR